MRGRTVVCPPRMDSPVRTYPAPGTLDDVLGFEMLEASPERCRGRFAVEKRVQQPLRARARRRLRGARRVDGRQPPRTWRSRATATSPSASRTTRISSGPATEGVIHAEGTPIHRGRTPGSGTCASRTTTTASAPRRA